MKPLYSNAHLVVKYHAVSGVPASSPWRSSAPEHLSILWLPQAVAVAAVVL